MRRSHPFARRPHTADLAGGVLLIVVGTLAACASVHERPLPSFSAAPPTPALDAARLRVRASELKRPVLTPVKIDLDDGVSPDEAAVLAVLLDPQLVSARSEHDVGRAQMLDAGILPNPVLGAGVDHPFGDGSSGADNVLDLTLSMDTRPLIASGAKRAVARASLEEIDLGIAWQEWQVAEQARLLTVRLGWLRRRLALARAELAFAEQTTTALDAAGAAGDTTLAQIGDARASLEAVRRTVHDLEQAETVTQGELLALLRQPRRERLEVSEPGEPAAPASFDVAALDACLPQRLDLQALQHGYGAAQERIRQAVLEQFPNVTVGVHYQRDESALQFIGGFVSFELPFIDRNQGSVAVGRATRRRLREGYTARAAAVRADLARMARMTALLRRQLAEAHASIAPLEAIEEKERDAVSRGDVDRLSYQTLRAALFDQRMQQAALSQALAEADVALLTACGGALPAPAPEASP